MLIDSDKYLEHERNCLKKKQIVPENLPPRSIENEKDILIERIPFKIEEELVPYELDKLTQIQIEAVTYMHQSSMKNHF